MSTDRTNVPAAAPLAASRDTEAASTSPSPHGAGGWARRIAVWLTCGALSVVFVYPLVWLVSASFKPRQDVFNNKLIPDPVELGNYAKVIDQLPFLRWTFNSLVVGLSAATAVTLSSALVAFGFAYFQFKGKNALFALVLGSMMLPSAATLIPTYLIWDRLGFTGTQVPLWAGNLFGSAFYIFLLRQFFRGLPREVFDAARVDGAGFFALFWRIALPMSKPALAITFILEFQASWVDLLKPLVYLNDTNLFTLPRGLKAVLDNFGQGGQREWEVVMAANVLVVLPMFLLFAVAGKYIMQGISVSGSKE